MPITPIAYAESREVELDDSLGFYTLEGNITINAIRRTRIYAPYDGQAFNGSHLEQVWLQLRNTHRNENETLRHGRYQTSYRDQDDDKVRRISQSLGNTARRTTHSTAWDHVPYQYRRIAGRPVLLDRSEPWTDEYQYVTDGDPADNEVSQWEIPANETAWTLVATYEHENIDFRDAETFIFETDKSGIDVEKFFPVEIIDTWPFLNYQVPTSPDEEKLLPDFGGCLDVRIDAMALKDLPAQPAHGKPIATKAGSHAFVARTLYYVAPQLPPRKHLRRDTDTAHDTYHAGSVELALRQVYDLYRQTNHRLGYTDGVDVYALWDIKPSDECRFIEVIPGLFDRYRPPEPAGTNADLQPPPITVEVGGESLEEWLVPGIESRTIRKIPGVSPDFNLTVWLYTGAFATMLGWAFGTVEEALGIIDHQLGPIDDAAEAAASSILPIQTLIENTPSSWIRAILSVGAKPWQAVQWLANEIEKDPGVDDTDLDEIMGALVETWTSPAGEESFKSLLTFAATRNYKRITARKKWESDPTKGRREPEGGYGDQDAFTPYKWGDAHRHAETKGEAWLTLQDAREILESPEGVVEALRAKYQDLDDADKAAIKLEAESRYARLKIIADWYAEKRRRQHEPIEGIEPADAETQDAAGEQL